MQNSTITLVSLKYEDIKYSFVRPFGKSRNVRSYKLTGYEQLINKVIGLDPTQWFKQQMV